MLTQAPRGTKDILPDEIGKWIFIEGKIRAICKKFGYSEIRTPLFEHTELFQRGIGDATDVVEKEMYTFEDRGGRSITLRPENTASAVRAYLEHKLYSKAAITKLFYIGSMFRFDRPQKGRFREFHQFGVEALGGGNPAVDAEIILLAVRFLESIGLKNLSLHINSVGDGDCRPKYREKLRNFFADKKDELCDDCRSRLEKNPLRILDCKNEHCQKLSEGVPEITDSLCDSCRDHFDKVQKYLTAAGVSFIIDPRLVRGLDYYARTAFEIKYDKLGAQSAIAGGGRYDGLIGEIGGDPAPAVGFAAGLERVMLAMEIENLFKNEEKPPDIFIISLGEAAEIFSFSIIDRLRSEGFNAISDQSGRSMKSQMKQADKSGARFAIIIGDDEAKENAVTIRDMTNGKQEKIPAESTAEYIRSSK